MRSTTISMLLSPVNTPQESTIANGGNVEIAKDGDLIGLVEGVSGLGSTSILGNGTFAAKFLI